MSDYFGIYRGIIVYNNDPENKGRVKVYIPGIYPESLAKDHTNLPWAELVMPIFGGNWKNESSNNLNSETGITSIPLTSEILLDGAQVWIFFENGCKNYPRIFGVSQCGDGWLSEHINQHVLKTKNVSVVIDENPTNTKSTMKFDSNNKKCTELSKDLIEESVPTRININIEASNKHAVNLNINGNVNLNINGNVYQQITGNKHETLIGDNYIKHIGNINYVHEGDVIYEHTGDYIEKRTGDTILQHNGNNDLYVSKDRNITVMNNNEETYFVMSKINIYGSYISIRNGSEIIYNNGSKINQITGDVNIITIGNYNFTSNKNINYITNDGNINLLSNKATGNITIKSPNIYKIAKYLNNDVVDGSQGGTINHNNSIYV